MVNKAKKGYRKEKLARDILVSEGWQIFFKSIRFRFGCIDFANRFDIVAYKDSKRKFISCKHDGSYLPHEQDIKDFADKYGKYGESYELWIWHKGAWRGRGENKKFIEPYFEKKVLAEVLFERN
jgi:hypothetical protein